MPNFHKIFQCNSKFKKVTVRQKKKKKKFKMLFIKLILPLILITITIVSCATYSTLHSLIIHILLA